MSEQIAIMRNVGLGLRDTDGPCLWFDAYLDEGRASLQILSWAEAGVALKNARVYDVKSLEGYPCWVELEDHLVKFRRVWAAR